MIAGDCGKNIPYARPDFTMKGIKRKRVLKKDVFLQI